MKSLKTGFNELDKLINGLNGGDLIGIAARRGMCKTSFGINLKTTYLNRLIKGYYISIWIH